MIAVTAAWNGLAANLMLQCRDACLRSRVRFPPHLSNTYSRIAHAGAGRAGELLTEFSIIVTLLGVCIAYQITFAALLKDAVLALHPSHSSSGDSSSSGGDSAEPWDAERVRVLLTLLSGFMAYPVSCVRNLDALSSLSAVGLCCLVLGIAAILVHGAVQFGAEALDFRGGIGDASVALPLLPASLKDVTSFFGIAVFCFDICSLAFPIEESMRRPAQFPVVVWGSLFFVWLLYALLGEFGALLYVHDSAHHGVKDNVLSNLPQQSGTAVLVRIAIAAVSLLTYPLTLTPAAQMVEHWLSASRVSSCSGSGSGSGGGVTVKREAAMGAHGGASIAEAESLLSHAAPAADPAAIEGGARGSCSIAVVDTSEDRGRAQALPLQGNNYASIESGRDANDLPLKSGAPPLAPAQSESWREFAMRSGNRLLLTLGTTLFATWVPCFGEVLINRAATTATTATAAVTTATTATTAVTAGATAGASAGTAAALTAPAPSAVNLTFLH